MEPCGRVLGFHTLQGIRKLQGTGWGGFWSGGGGVGLGGGGWGWRGGESVQGQTRALFHMPLNGFLIPFQGFALGRFAQIAAFNVQEQLNLPRPEGVAVHVSAKQFLDQAVELRQDCVAIW